MFQRFFLSDAETTTDVGREVASGRVRRVRRGLYTTDTVTPLESLVVQHLCEIVRLLAPGSVIGYRTAIELGPSPEGVVHLVGPKHRRLEIHGTKILIHEGAGPLEGDQPYMDTLYLASRARAYLECLRPSRSGKAFGDKGLSREELESRLDQRLRIRGQDDLNQLRDEARAIAHDLDAVAEFEELDGIVGSLLSTRDAPLASRVGQARAAGRPYDPDRLRLFHAVHRALLDNPLPDRRDPFEPGSVGFSNAAFFDAYFSNWIEGTEFELEEARKIVTEGAVPENRPADGHDVLGTFALVSDPVFMTKALGLLLDSPEQFESVLHDAHRRILSARPEHHPGQFKTAPNRAGTTVFVLPDLVRGTLREAHGLIESLPDGLPRAAYLMFVISEIHPYSDGNGRVARAVMNGALVASGQSRVLIPTGYREDYLRALKALSHQGATGPFVSMIDRAQQYMAELPLDDYAETVAVLHTTRAMDETGDRRLRLPSEVG